MKLTLGLLLSLIVQGWAINSYSQKTVVNLDLKNVDIIKVLDEIEKQTDYYFLFNYEQIHTDKKIDVKLSNSKIDEVLNKILEGTGLNYSVKNRQIVISKESPDGINEQFSSSSVQQQKSISGKITDSSGGSLPGASVVVKGTTTGTITDFEGNYSLTNVPANAILQFSFVGMKIQEITVAGKSTINVILIDDAVGIDEVVAIGYGTQKKVVSTGSIVSTAGDELVKSPAQNLANSLTGRLPGVVINNRSGEPGYDDPTILIRGKSTTGNASPLFIIDGVEREGFSRLNPNDIENVTVLKDASAAIYGARAANGVILVTTKRGTVGKPVFDVSFNQGFTQPSRELKMADSYLFAQVTNEYRASQGLTPAYADADLQKFKDGSDPDKYPNTNWQKQMIKNLTPTQRANISVTGGNEKSKYMVSLGFLNQPGQYKYGTHQYQQFNFRSNIDVNVTKYFSFGFDLSGRLEDKHQPGEGIGDITSHLQLYLPTWTLFWPGTNYPRPLRDSKNIYNNVTDATGYTDNIFKGITSTLFFKLDIPWVKGLSVDGSANYDAGYNFNKAWITPEYTYKYDGTIYTKTLVGQSKASLNEFFNHNSATTLNTKINYKGNFGKNNVEAMFGYEQRQTNYDYLLAGRTNYISEALPELFAGSSNKNNQSNDGTSVKTARQNIFGRASYDYAGKYMGQVLFRYDGSQNFAKDKRFGFFPGISLGWRMSEEPFMKNLGFVDNLKIRGSYGELGNDLVPSYQYLTSFTYATLGSSVIGNSDVSGFNPNNVPNPNITWEVAKSTNLGLETTLWNGKLGAEIELFKTRRSNILTKRNAIIPDYTGLVLPDENIGIVENKGFELQLSHKNNRHALKYSFTGNLSFAKNKVIFSDEQPGAEVYQLATGHPMNTSLYYVATGGIFKDQAQIDNTPHAVGTRPGDIIHKDMNNDGVINSLDQMRIDITNVPQIVYGFTVSLKYKNFDFTALVQGQEKANYYSRWHNRLNTDVGNFFEARAKDHWTPNNTEASMPRNEFGGNSPRTNSTFWVENAGFLRLKNVEFGYNLPQNLMDKLQIQALRVYISGYNLLYIYDHLKNWGIDPESDSGSTTTFYYPQQRVFNMGINVTF